MVNEKFSMTRAFEFARNKADSETLNRFGKVDLSRAGIRAYWCSVFDSAYPINVEDDENDEKGVYDDEA